MAEQNPFLTLLHSNVAISFHCKGEGEMRTLEVMWK